MIYLYTLKQNMMNIIPTWEELESSDQFDDYGSMYRYLCKLHVEAALKSASENAKTKEKRHDLSGRQEYVYSTHVDKESILSAYPLTNIS